MFHEGRKFGIRFWKRFRVECELSVDQFHSEFGSNELSCLIGVCFSTKPSHVGDGKRGLV